ncbi:hypothetical protein SAMN04488552_0410 [Christiangramia echinicola]|uniref:Signal transduction histidine kinase internal region domain-containing protein n=1 Tax=Christiangramia echinicola TaxID=279359 RepID=A0A1H1KYU3_9FLAO|nr:histidine kinase [Christiangramia echinicola]SDR67521.1 hypothetical protein SAMN04488552_0410 [Christiangramia echinicola]
MPFYRISKLLLLLFFWFNLAFAQNFPGKNYTSANELPNNTVRSLLVDSNNTLWVGTDNGVVKKENDLLKSFFEEDGLAMNSCWSIAEDHNNHIWFGSYGGGVSIYDGRNFKVISEADGLIHNEVTKLFSFKDHMFVGTSDGVSVININSLEIYSPKAPTQNELFRVTGFSEFQDLLYISTYRTGIYKISFKKDQFIFEKVNDRKFIYSVFVDNDSIYSSNKGFYTKNLLADYVNSEDSIITNKLGRSIIWDHVKTVNNMIYAAAWGIYDTNGGIYEIKNNELISRASDFSIPSKNIISLAYDENFERLYIGSLDAGLFEINLDPQVKFNEISGNDVLGFAETKNTSAILLNDGLLLKQAKNEQKISLNQLKQWQQEYVRTTKIPLPKYEDSFYELDYTTRAEEIMFYDIKVSEKKYWLNTNIGIYVIENSGELDRYIPLHSEEINFTKNGDLIETHPYGGVRIYSDLDTFQFEYYEQEAPQTPTLVVNSLGRGPKTYFLSVFSGLYSWEEGKFRSYLDEGIWRESKLRHITPLGRDMAISNEFGDIFIVNDEDQFNILQKIPRAKIPGNTISFLKEYKDHLLIGTEKGLTIFKDRRQILLDSEQGLKQPFLSTEVKENRLFLGTNGGYYNIDLDAVIDPRALVDQVKLEGIYINNNELPLKQIPGKEKIDLAYDQNTVLLEFSTNAHPYPKKLKYQYRLNPNADWSLPSSKPEIFLPFLPINKYEVTLRVSDASTGLYYTQPLTNLSIKPPFWKTWWFILLIIIILLLLVFGIYKYQIRQHKEFEAQKRLIQKRFEETKMEALLSQMNPHFIFNAMNSIQNYIVDSDIDNASIFLGDFAKLIRLNLDHCTKPKILLEEEIEYLRSYIRVENTRYDNAVKVIFDIDPTIDTYDVEIPTMILQTFIENVFVHAFPAGVKNPTLKVAFKQLSQNILQCKVEDNGIGISENHSGKLHQSKGVNLVKERLALLGYDLDKTIQISTDKNKGTSVVIELVV